MPYAPDPNLTDEELEQYQKDVENHPLTEQRKALDEENKKLEEQVVKARQERAELEAEQAGQTFHSQPEVAYEQQTPVSGVSSTSVETSQNIGSTEPGQGDGRKQAKRVTQKQAEENKSEENKSEENKSE